ncbi:DUF3570 domain-containing protein [Bacteriovorax sp. PP10]|uniref:DUF3570 domain-containing protein n=1 Tax=Bacteriovorax antarcticus TaxID=3088717 RepID=A0ABU5VX47_9BACT|nr:DUF3570 domain-containing protein [Bacteriovorax sp. PP10]MEA9357640.1 DUF3570 domain-containing protein [Bacteriovorax sp. PP10]
MDVIKFNRIMLTILLLVLSVQNAFAEMMEKGKTKVKTLLNVYNQKSSTGKQVLDNSGNEKVTVIEPEIFVKHQISADTEINASFTIDTWTAESDTILDGNTGASGSGKKGQSRIAPNIGVRREVGKNKYGMNLGFSSEYDYTSKNISADFERSFADDNFTLGIGGQYYADTVSLFPDITPPANAKITKDLKRDIYAINLGASQILTRKDIVEVGVTYANSKGRLESTAGTVNIAGTREVEVLPGKRERSAISTKWVHALSDEMAFNLSYRNYFDDWGSHANTVRAAYLIALREEQDFIEIALRYHSQSAVDYYKDSFGTTERFMTSDSDMSKFSSVEPSVMYSRSLGGLHVFGVEFQDAEWGTSLTYAKRNTGLQYTYLQTSLAFSF